MVSVVSVLLPENLMKNYINLLSISWIVEVVVLDAKGIGNSNRAIDDLGNDQRSLLSNAECGAPDSLAILVTARLSFLLRIFRRDVLLTCCITNLQHHSTIYQQYLVSFVTK